MAERFRELLLAAEPGRAGWCGGRCVYLGRLMFARTLKLDAASTTWAAEVCSAVWVVAALAALAAPMPTIEAAARTAPVRTTRRVAPSRTWLFDMGIPPE